MRARLHGAVVLGGMDVLVVVASRHGATEEIAQEVAASLAERGLQTTVAGAECAPPPDAFDAVVLGSAVYMGHWLEPARTYVDAHRAALSVRPVWLFSSGPLGEPPLPAEDPVDVAPIMEATGARGHRVFAGRLDKRKLGFGEKAVVLALRAPEGDFRDWDAIRAWARGIAAAAVGRG